MKRNWPLKCHKYDRVFQTSDLLSMTFADILTLLLCFIVILVATEVYEFDSQNAREGAPLAAFIASPSDKDGRLQEWLSLSKADNGKFLVAGCSQIIDEIEGWRMSYEYVNRAKHYLLKAGIKSRDIRLEPLGNRCSWDTGAHGSELIKVVVE